MSIIKAHSFWTVARLYPEEFFFALYIDGLVLPIEIISIFFGHTFVFVTVPAVYK